MMKNQLRILVPEMDFLAIIAAGDLTVIHAVVDSINLGDSISSEINNNLHFPVIKMTTTNQFSVVVVVEADEVAVVSTPVVAVEAASIVLVVIVGLKIRAAVSTILGKAVSINQVVVSMIINPPLAEVVLAVVVSVVVIMVDLAEVVSAVVSVMLLIVHRHPTTKDTIPILMIFTIM